MCATIAINAQRQTEAKHIWGALNPVGLMVLCSSPQVVGSLKTDVEDVVRSHILRATDPDYAGVEFREHVPEAASPDQAAASSDPEADAGASSR